MDIENGYFLVRFQSRVDYDLALTQGSWISRYVFQDYQDFFTKKRILEEVGSLIGKVMKLDLRTDSGARGQFARISVSIDMDKPLTSQVLINNKIQRVEFKALPMVYFSCGKYGHLKISCPSSIDRSMAGDKEDSPATVNNEKCPVTENDAFRPWMVVQRKSRQNQSDKRNQHARILEENLASSRFIALTPEDKQPTDSQTEILGAKNSGFKGISLKQ
ncbi:hypothetical protein J1N35_029783 [Gossypium stocksii]|uniref:Zinc knuckle CX2CX4HX4C domain-containing protein n=1 Tax=Gossypium stocksii TaxID=47602 RepID=A0A9D3UYK5_9ROSI|nr:hypothetical protein J1N35_029783 [Gossypium stocksii]